MPHIAHIPCEVGGLEKANMIERHVFSLALPDVICSDLGKELVISKQCKINVTCMALESTQELHTLVSVVASSKAAIE